MRDADLRALGRSEDEEAQLRRQREEWRRDTLGAERLEVAALLGSELAGELSGREPAETSRGLLLSLLAVGPGARARTCYAALRVAAPLWEVLRFDGRARRLVELCGQAIASEGRADAAAALLEGAEGFRWLPGGEVVSQLVGRALAAGGAAIADPHEGAGEGAVEGGGREYAALGWAAASLARLPLHERGLVRSNPGADLPLGVGQALRGQRTGAPTRDAYAPRPPLGISQAQWPQGSTPARVQRQDRLPAGPWEGGPGGIQTLVVAVARQLEPWCLDGTELPGIEAAQ